MLTTTAHYFLTRYSLASIMGTFFTKVWLLYQDESLSDKTAQYSDWKNFFLPHTIAHDVELNDSRPLSSLTQWLVSPWRRNSHCNFTPFNSPYTSENFQTSTWITNRKRERKANSREHQSKEEIPSEHCRNKPTSPSSLNDRINKYHHTGHG